MFCPGIIQGNIPLQSNYSTEFMVKHMLKLFTMILLKTGEQKGA